MVWCGVVQSAWPSWVMWHMHAPNFKKWHEKKKKKKKNRYIGHIEPLELDEGSRSGEEIESPIGWTSSFNL
jgi:hypothetical protein